MLAVACLAVPLAACSSLGASGPSTSSVRKIEATQYDGSDVKIIDLDNQVVRRVAAVRNSRNFSEIFGEAAVVDTVIGYGDALDISMWEAPPAVLFGAMGADVRPPAGISIAQSAALPGQVVGNDGLVSVPFVGRVQAAGRTPAEVQHEISARLRGKANDPQVVVRLVQNETRNVTIIGEVAASRRVPLSARGERLLDAIAAAGGSRQPVGKTTIQLSRGATVAAMALDDIIRNPAQNVRLLPDDVVTVLFQPYSFIALGAVNQNAEVPFEGGGLTLAQALGRTGGLRDERADIRGVFVFRMEDPAALDPSVTATARTTLDGRVPVVYRLNLSDASSLFAAQDFAIRDRDILYISNAPGTDLQKFLNSLSTVAFSAISVGNAVR
ncbi:polysaccharide export protein [Altererythrobacter xixiisoli]|uniref:Polysaccharide export protein n=1 Tax=Croceibacterium xixiisoli TaxID=1476466 RepID=A0A6I4TTA7_9SPHN|nr:polysaccharide biosynthesis/export family protein [Croceibacterium xixiisoli]MXO99206.1 polysaccharide export protein [Croceibacterium xixiisoli]